MAQAFTKLGRVRGSVLLRGSTAALQGPSIAARFLSNSRVLGGNIFYPIEEIKLRTMMYMHLNNISNIK